MPFRFYRFSQSYIKFNVSISKFSFIYAFYMEQRSLIYILVSLPFWISLHVNIFRSIANGFTSLYHNRVFAYRAHFIFRRKSKRGLLLYFELFSQLFLSYFLFNERSRTLIRAKNMCWWYIHNIPRTGAAPSTCSRKLDALRENLTVCQLLSLRTPCPPNKF